jgi:hypothetical protein
MTTQDPTLAIALLSALQVFLYATVRKGVLF